MDEFLKWLSANPSIIVPLLASFIILLLVIALIFVGAFVQGREIYFWPPKIGPKPEKMRVSEDASNSDKDSVPTKNTRVLNKAIPKHVLDFFGIGLNKKCLIVINHYPGKPNTMSHGDIEVLVELVEIVHSVDGKATVAPFDKELKPPGSITEFCIGGPEANKRTQAHLANYLKGVRINPYSQNNPESLAIRVKGEVFRYENSKREYALLTKFRNPNNPESHPVFLICGQTSLSNKSAVYYLSQNWAKTISEKYGAEKFCLIVRPKDILNYGPKEVELVRDISDIAFVPWDGIE